MREGAPAREDSVLPYRLREEAANSTLDDRRFQDLMDTRPLVWVSLEQPVYQLVHFPRVDGGNRRELTSDYLDCQVMDAYWKGVEEN